MFRKIIVPLDGSTRAECAVPLAAHIARASHGTVVLLQTVTPDIDYGYRPHFAHNTLSTTSVQQREVQRAANYLSALSHSEALIGVKTETVAMEGMAVPGILACARLHEADLLIMSSHGYTGLKRWVFGSVAQKVVRHSPVPVLVLREDGPAFPSGDEKLARPLRVLVALDGSPLAETVLTPAVQLIAALAGPGQGELHLAQVIEVPSDLDHKKLDLDLLEQARREASHSLSAIADKVSTGGAAEYNVKISWAVLTGSDVADVLIEAAELGDAEGTCKNCDLIAITTHGRSGLQRWMTGSVTERLLGGTWMPLYVVHAGDEPLASETDQDARKQDQHTSTAL